MLLPFTYSCISLLGIVLWYLPVFDITDLFPFAKFLEVNFVKWDFSFFRAQALTTLINLFCDLKIL